MASSIYLIALQQIQTESKKGPEKEDIGMK